MFFKKSFVKRGWHRISGRNNQGRITVRHRGGGRKRKVFFIDFFRFSSCRVFTVCGFIWRINMSSLVILKSSNIFNSSFYTLIVNTKGLVLGDSVINNVGSGITLLNLGSSYFLRDFPVGSFINCLETNPFLGSKLIRSSGCFGIILQVEGLFVLVKLPSGQLAYFPPYCRATFGEVSSKIYKVSFYKAGNSRFFGFRPSVRGVAINSVDHPHGGGEGKSRIGRNPVSPWGFKLGMKKRKV
jgi:large subunit ribosomal protein L2